MLGYLLARGLWVGSGRRASPLRSVWPTWVIAAAAVFLLGFRIGLNVETPRGVIDVGLAGVAGASRILDGEAPYGNMPQRGTLEPCGPKDADGQVRDRIQTNGRCEAAIERGDTYGPVSYLGYVPATAIFGWSGKWDSLPAAHATSIAFDVLTILGLVLVGLRFGGFRLAALLAFAWTAYPFTAYTLNANTNDTIMPAFLVFGFCARLVCVGKRCGGRTRRLDEVRSAAPGSALGDVPELRCATARALCSRVRRGDPARVHGPAARARSLESRADASGIARSDSRSAAIPRFRSGAGGSTTPRESPTSGSSNQCWWCSQSCSRYSSPSCLGRRARSS